VKGGSIVEAIEAVDGPTRARPAMKRTIGMTVETEASTAVHMSPSPDTWTSPRTSAATAKAAAAPVTTLAANGTGGVVAAMRSEARM